MGLIIVYANYQTRVWTWFIFESHILKGGGWIWISLINQSNLMGHLWESIGSQHVSSTKVTWAHHGLTRILGVSPSQDPLWVTHALSTFLPKSPMCLTCVLDIGDPRRPNCLTRVLGVCNALRFATRHVTSAPKHPRWQGMNCEFDGYRDLEIRIGQ